MLNNSNYGGPFLFPLFAVIPDDQSVKNVHDAYDVYVNDDFIGKKKSWWLKRKISRMCSTLYESQESKTPSLS